MKTSSLDEGQIERFRQRRVQLLQLRASQSSNIGRRLGFQNGHESIAMDTGFMFHPFVDTDTHLGRKTVVPGINRSADYRRKARIDNKLPADDDEYPLLSGIRPAGSPDRIKVAAPHLFRQSLEFKDVSGLFVQSIGVSLVKGRVMRTPFGPLSPRQIVTRCIFQESGPIRLDSIDLRQHFFRECS